MTRRNPVAQLPALVDVEASEPAAEGTSEGGQLSVSLDQVIERAGQLATGGISAGTQTAYTAAWLAFDRWCAAAGITPPWFPVRPELLVLYIAALELRGVSYSFIRRSLSGLRWHHVTSGQRWPGDRPRAPVVERALSELVRTHGKAPRAPKRAILLDELRAMLVELEDNPADLRARAALSIGWFTGLRRSELAALWWDDLTFDGPVLVVRSVGGKTRQAGEVEYFALPLWSDPVVCPVRAVTRWRAHCERLLPQGLAGPFLRPVDRNGRLRDRPLSPRDVARILGRCAERAGLPERERIGAHSLRRGVILWLIRQGIRPERVARHIGHRSVVTTLGYAAPLDAIDDSPFVQLVNEPVSGPPLDNG